MRLGSTYQRALSQQCKCKNKLLLKQYYGVYTKSSMKIYDSGA